MGLQQVATWGAAALLTAGLLAGCGDDATEEPAGDSTTTEEESTTTQEPTTTTEAPTTTEPPSEPVDACGAVGPEQVAAVLGPGASAGEPVTVEVSNDGCLWRSASGADAMGAASLTTIPGAGESQDLFPLFGLDPSGYGTTGVSTSRSGSGGPSVVVVYGFSTVDTARDVSDAVSGVAAALSS